jgi:hypothetical protein
MYIYLNTLRPYLCPDTTSQNCFKTGEKPTIYWRYDKFSIIIKNSLFLQDIIIDARDTIGLYIYIYICIYTYIVFLNMSGTNNPVLQACL